MKSAVLVSLLLLCMSLCTTLSANSVIPLSSFDANTPINGRDAYPRDGTTDSSDFTCDETGYLNYLSYWTTAQKGSSRDTASAEFQQRLEYFKDSCEKIHEWNLRDRYRMEFTFYAD